MNQSKKLIATPATQEQPRALSGQAARFELDLQSAFGGRPISTPSQQKEAAFWQAMAAASALPLQTVLANCSLQAQQGELALQHHQLTSQERIAATEGHTQQVVAAEGIAQASSQAFNHAVEVREEADAKKVGHITNAFTAAAVAWAGASAAKSMAGAAAAKGATATTAVTGQALRAGFDSSDTPHVHSDSMVFDMPQRNIPRPQIRVFSTRWEVIAEPAEKVRELGVRINREHFASRIKNGEHHLYNEKVASFFPDDTTIVHVIQIGDYPPTANIQPEIILKTETIKNFLKRYHENDELYLIETKYLDL